MQNLDKKGYYITETYRSVECNRYIPSVEQKDVCKCGNERNDHTSCDIFVEDSALVWNYKIDTKQVPTDAYGDIDFRDLAADFLPRYLRCSWDTDCKDLSTLMLSKWQMPKPNLIMVVIGGKMSFSHNLHFLEAIQNGIVEAAVSTQAWIFTGGMDSGVSQLVGEAVGMRRTFKQVIPTIGIAAWGTIKDNYQLVDPDGSFPASYDKHLHNKSPHLNVRGLKELEPNHTNFIFADYGTKKDYHAIELHKFNVKLEKRISKDTEAHLITILIEGGLTAMIEASQRVKDNIPIVVICGSGRAADLISRVLQITNDQHDKNHWVSLTQRNEVQTMIEEYFNSSADKVFLKDAMKSVEVLLKHREYITVWKDEQDGRVDKHILIGLINSLSYQPHKPFTRKGSVSDTMLETKIETNTLLYKQIELAITWNRLDLAEELLFTQIDLQQRQFNELLHNAIHHKQVDFMKSFLERGADLKSFLTEERFDELLSDKDLLPDNKLLHRLLNKQRSKAADHPMFEHFAKVIYDVSEGVYKCPRKLTTTRDVSKFITKKGQTLKLLVCSTANTQKRSELRFVVGHMNPAEFDMPCDGSPAFQDPENLLVLYFVMIHEQEMAKATWSHSRTPLILALICSNLCAWLAHQENKMKEITQDMKVYLLMYAEEWEQLALAILNEAARRNTQAWVQTLIKHKFYSWGGRSTLDIAVASKSQKFIAHNAVQQYVTKSWMGKLDADTRYWKILISSFIGPWWFIRFNKVKDHNPKRMGKQAKERKKQAFICATVGGDIVDETMADKHSMQMFTKWIRFYQAPVTKYFIHIFIYTIYLVTFMYALVIKTHNESSYIAEQRKRTNSTVNVSSVLYFNRFSTPEIIIFAWAFAVVPVEVRQIFNSIPSTIPGKFSKYIHNQYNKNDVCSFLLLLAAFVIRIMHLRGPTWTYMFQLIFSVAFILNVVRVAQFLQIHAKIGPKITMISSMFTDLFFFVTIVAICICAYGVATESLVFPTKRPFTADIMFGIVWRPYINLFGELGVDDIDENLELGYCHYWNEMHNASVQYDCSGDDYSCDNDNICKSNRIIVKIMLGVYMMLAAVLMLNLLIAVFSHTYENLNTQSDKLWKWQRFDLMREFQHRSAIPYPFNTITYFLRAGRWTWRKLCGASSFFEHRERSKKQDEYKRSNIALLENECRRNVMKQHENNEQISIRECLDKLNKVQNYVQGFDGQMQAVLDSTVHTVFNEEIGSGTIGFPGYFSDHEIETDASIIAPSSIPLLQSPISPLNRKKTMKYLEVPSVQSLYYPGTDIKRVPVKEQHVEWMVPVLNYKPPFYNLYQTTTENIKWNQGDTESYGGHYFVKSGIPLNPMGRTGFSGKGTLERWGPNYASVPIITRFLHSHAATSLEAELEVVCRKNTLGEYELPELKTTIDQPLPKTAKDLFSNISTENNVKTVQKTIQKIWKRGILIKRGLMESAYNTDNAWLECIIISYHDDDDKALKYVIFDRNSGYQWTRVVHGMFSKTHHHKYFERAVYARRVSQYIGEDNRDEVFEEDK